MDLVLYVKPGCSLCDEALEVLDEAAGGPGRLAVRTVNILTDEALFARYRQRVPVLAVDGREALELRFTVEEARAALARR